MRTPLAQSDAGSISLATLWKHGISGDLPIVLVRIDQPEERGLVRDLLRAQEYWRMKGLLADLVIINEKPGSYVEDLQKAIEELIREAGHGIGQAIDGRVFVLNGPLLSPSDRSTLQAAARAVLLSHHGTLGDQLARRPSETPATSAPDRGRPWPLIQVDGRQPRPELEFHNGLGGFAADGREYVVILGEGQSIPGALDQRRRQLPFRVLRFGIGVGLHLGREQPREPADPVVQRSRRRPPG